MSPVRAVTAEALLEREDERALLASLVARAAAGDGSVLVAEGQAGVGKTEILRAAVGLGEEHGLAVLRGRGSELDRTFAFGLARRLLTRAVAGDPGLLTGGAEAAAAVLAPSVDAPPNDLYAVLDGLHWLVSNLAERRPLLLVADDIHWADRASLRWLVFLAERIEDVPVLLLAATRPAEPGADQELLDALATSPAAHLVRPAPLTPAAAATLVGRVLPAATGAFAAACHRATGGNPFLLGELLRELAADGATGTAAEAGAVIEFGSERVGRAVRRRLRLLPAEATALARAVAVLGPDAPLEEAAGLAALPPGEAARTADALASVEVLEAGPGLDFVHPVVRAAVYEQIPPLEAQALHSAAAQAQLDRGADPEGVARHLLRLPPAGQPERIAVLREAARTAAARGGASAAASYLRRALDEPPAAGERFALLRELGVIEAFDRQHEAFAAHLREALAVAPDAAERARAALDFGRSLAAFGDFDEARGVLAEGLAGCEDEGGELAVALEAELLAVAMLDGDLRGAAARRLARRSSQARGGGTLPGPTLGVLALASALSAAPASSTLELAERAVAGGAVEEPVSVVSYSVMMALHAGGAIARSAGLMDQGIERARRLGSRLTVAGLHLLRSRASLDLGEVRRAEIEARFVVDRFGEGIGEAARVWAVAVLLDALVARGAIEEAEDLLAASRGSFGAATTLVKGFLHDAVARLRLIQGRADEARHEAESAGAVLGETAANPMLSTWRSASALALAALDRRDDALVRARSELEDARRVGLADVEGVALRTLGLVTGGHDGVELLREALAAHGGAERPLERMRTRLELGAALRRTGARAESRDVLRVALAELSSAGASGLADRAHEELVTAGARPRRERRMLSGRESLTASEDRVAALAAEGLTNREIAQRLFVTVKAVQWHLRNVYRKLDVSSREDLPDALERGA